MSWLKIDDRWPEHPAIAGLKPSEKIIWITAAAWSARNNTLGAIPKGVVPILLAQSQAPKSAVNALVDAGLWDRTDDGFAFTETLNPFPTQEQIENKRKNDRDRQAARRARIQSESRTRHAVTTSDLTCDVTGDIAPRHGPVSVPEPEPEINSFKKPPTVVPFVTSGGGGETNDATAAAIDELATLELAAAVASGAQIIDRQRYRARIVKRIAAERTGEISRLIEGNRHLGPLEIARLAFGPLPPEPVTAETSQVLATIARDRSCPDCHGTGWTVDDDNTAIPCEHSHTATATA